MLDCRQYTLFAALCRLEGVPCRMNAVMHLNRGTAGINSKFNAELS